MTLACPAERAFMRRRLRWGQLDAAASPLPERPARWRQQLPLLRRRKRDSQTDPMNDDEGKSSWGFAGSAKPFRVARPEALGIACAKPGPLSVDLLRATLFHKSTDKAMLPWPGGGAGRRTDSADARSSRMRASKRPENRRLAGTATWLRCSRPVNAGCIRRGGCVDPPCFFRLMWMSAGSLGTDSTIQMLQVLSGWYNAWKSRANQAI
jgi:hypothetical protein